MAQQTTGLGTAVKLVSLGNVNPTNPTPGYNGVKLSLSAATYPTTFQLNPNIEDAGGNEQAAGTQFTLTAVAAHSGNTSVYTGTITGGASNAFVGETFVVAGFVTNPVNNGTFICTASSATTLTLENTAAIAETHAATATQQETLALTYWSQNPSVATVSASGLVTSVVKGRTVIEVSYPAFNNTAGTTGAQNSGPGGVANPMHGLPLQKIYVEVNVEVLL